MISLLEIDHAGYLTSRLHRREVHAAIRRMSKHRQRQVHLSVLHERDGSCCDTEEWVKTALRVQQALSADGCRVAWAFMDAQASTVVVPR